ncbi:LytTR family transcriptional regulator DNA-binding domain-containing protein [Bhargavaea cecembensis]|uniref:LytTR family transcriptional regulator DNA-binding domain-containing protein n=1 Tax=Bhargavaea cecembensis TaxID=394098 RepID=UPI00058F97D6|nr:LytTR family transcriptional regulator DNA-binding domain-containing protein [Bhargavaea cecembensis]
MTRLEFRQVEKSAGNAVVFPRFDLSVEAGSFAAVQCDHEAGRRLIGLVTGMEPLLHGEVRFGGEPVAGRFRELSGRIGVLLLDDELYERLTPAEYLRLFRDLHGGGAPVDELLRRVGLADKTAVRSGKLSRSEKRRLQLARAIVHGPELLLLEEPEQNLDIESRVILQRVLGEFTAAGGSVLLTTSNLENAVAMTDTVYRLNRDGLKRIDLAPEEDPAAEEEEHPVEEVPPAPAPDAAETPDAADGPSSFQIRFDKVPAKVNDKLILFDPTEIVFVESTDGVSMLHVNGETFPCALTLGDLAGRLEPFGFFRCHRSYLVNLQRVREVITWTRNSYSLILEDPNKSSVPLSKGKYAELKTFLGI